MMWVRCLDGHTIYINPNYISVIIETDAAEDPNGKKYTKIYLSEGSCFPLASVTTEESIENIYQKIQRDLQRPRDEVVTRLDRILAEMERQGRKK